MNRTGFDRYRRDAILKAWIEARVEYSAAMDHAERLVPWGESEFEVLSEAERHRARMALAERDYFAELPRVNMSVCPICSAELVRSFDPFGFDGLWWRPDANPDEPAACPHFNLLCGAVSYGAERPSAPNFDVYPGPEAPYVIPAILQQASMTAVIGRISMMNGYVAYPIAYFSEKRQPPEELTAEWRRSIYNFSTSQREDRWRIPTDPWDFDLSAWLAAGRLRWYPSRGAFPYAGLPGRKRQLVVSGNRIATWEPSRGAAGWPAR